MNWHPNLQSNIASIAAVAPCLDAIFPRAAVASSGSVKGVNFHLPLDLSPSIGRVSSYILSPLVADVGAENGCGLGPCPGSRARLTTRVGGDISTLWQGSDVDAVLCNDDIIGLRDVLNRCWTASTSFNQLQPPVKPWWNHGETIRLTQLLLIFLIFRHCLQQQAKSQGLLISSWPPFTSDLKGLVSLSHDLGIKRTSPEKVAIKIDH